MSATCPTGNSSWVDAKDLIVIGHRGSGNVTAPENTFAAFDSAASIGAAIETDIRRTLDGVFVLIHDSTVDRTTGTAAGDVATLTYNQLLSLDAAQIYRPDLFSPQRIPSFDEYLRKYGKDNLLTPEIKGGVADAVAVATLVKRYCLQRSVLVQSFFGDDLVAVHEVDPTIPTALISSVQVSPLSAAAAKAAAVTVQYPSVDSAYVAAMHASGVRVITYSVDSLTDAERLIADGVDGIISNDPELVQWANRFTPRGSTRVSTPSSLVGSGWRPFSSVSGAKPAVDSGLVTFEGGLIVTNGAFTRLYLPFVRTNAAGDVLTIDTKLKIEKWPTSGDTTRYVGLRFCWSTDTDVAPAGTGESVGYSFLHRLSGEVELVRTERATRTVLSRATWSPLAATETLPMHVEVTASGLTVTRVDTAVTVAASGPMLPCTGFVSVYAAGVVPGIGETTVTY